MKSIRYGAQWFDRHSGRRTARSAVLLASPLVVVAAVGAVSVATQQASPIQAAVAIEVEPEEVLASVDPARLVDTRSGEGIATDDGQFLGLGRVEADTTTAVTVAGRGDVPASASSALLSVTMVNPGASGFTTVFPCEADGVGGFGTPPTASNGNFRAGVTTANAALAQIGTDGQVCVYSSADAHLVVDVSGYTADSASPSTIAPARLLDTRADADADATIDGVDVGGGPVSANAITEVVVAGRGSVDAAASAAVLNITAVGPSAAGFVTVWPCGVDMPLASNLNFTASATVPNMAIVGLGADGTVCVSASVETDLLVDVNGFVSTEAQPTTVVPARLLDTRASGETVDDESVGGGAVPAESTTRVEVTDRGDVPDGADSVLLNVTTVNATEAGYVTVYACGTEIPNASNVNFLAGSAVASFVVAGVGVLDQVCVFSSASTDLIVDVSGYIDTTADPTPTATGAVDPDLFVDGALTEEVTAVDCILSDGAETTCYSITVAGYPASRDVGPFCPSTIEDTVESGGIWFDGEALYELDGQFFVDVPTLYGDGPDDADWAMYDDSGNIFVTETAEEFEAAAQPAVDPSLYQHCVEGRLEWLENGEAITSTVLIPAVPVPADSAAAPSGNLGVTLDGVVIAPSAPVDAILGNYTIAAFDDCGAHFNPVEGYHMHGAVGCSEVGEDIDGDAPQFGYAMDGYPVHSPLDADEAVVADLDECSGHTTPDAGYHYHANNAAENLVIECLVGQVVTTDDDGGGGGGPGGGGPGGPPGNG